MDTFRKTLAGFFAALFVITTVLAILFFNFDRRAFTAGTYQKAFAREDFYNKLPRLMAQSLSSADSEQGQLPLVMQGMSVDAWENFIRALLPPDTLRVIGDDVLNSTFAYLNLQSDSVQVALTPIKTSMASDAGTQAVFSLMASLPPCTLAQVAQTSFNLLSGGEIQLCNPPAEMLPLLTPIVQAQLQFAAAIIPDQLTLLTAPTQNDPRLRLQAIRFFLRLSPILPILFLLMLTVSIVRSLKDWLSWWGFPFLAAGVIAFFMGLVGAPIVGAVFERVLIKRLPIYLPAFFSEFTGEIASAMVRALLTPVLWQGLALMIIGVGFVAAWYFLFRREQS